MVQRICNHAAVMVLGLFVGVVLTAAWFGVGRSCGQLGSEPWGPGQWGTQVHATATHGEGNFAIATGLLSDHLEAFIFLDFLTGDLRAAAVSRRTGEFVAFFERNIQQDFTSQSKNPKYLMVSGLADIPRGRAALQVGQSLIYIAEASSGEVSAYALLWSESLNNRGEQQRGEFKRLAGGSFRTTFVRDE